jgi:hypothetical protein
MEHLPLGGDVCTDCEIVYQSRRGELQVYPWFLLGFVVPWGYVLAMWNHLPGWSARSGGVRAITTGVPMLDVMIMCTVAAVFAGKAAASLRRKLHRRAFVRETARSGP